MGHHHGDHHGNWNNGQWSGGFYGVAPTQSYNGAPIGHYDPNYNYPGDHPYHHSNFSFNGQPIGAYQQGYSYPQGHPYYNGY